MAKDCVVALKEVNFIIDVCLCQEVTPELSEIYYHLKRLTIMLYFQKAMSCILSRLTEDPCHPDVECKVHPLLERTTS